MVGEQAALLSYTLYSSRTIALEYSALQPGDVSHLRRILYPNDGRESIGWLYTALTATAGAPRSETRATQTL